ncbi:hypothetical protein R3Q06_12415 [Rhodococcus erythropolis]|uniref:hypothetical protein n=1 Tax=Rhodococcus erythropolis TaxID=1833 RepID=UPI0029491AD9|nr:hypothetical protein [Rhodococcus erythropolis]MDV6274307.1 hypothetical protein [Rhodococcus erythropolis]
MTRFNPWHYLKTHHPHLKVEYVDLERISCVGRWTRNAIHIDRTANQVERRTGLTHEMCHVESGPIPLDTHAAIIEERAIELRTAKLLITLDQLVPALIEHEQRIDDDTAETLWVPLPVLQTRMTRLTPQECMYINDQLSRRSY